MVGRSENFIKLERHVLHCVQNKDVREMLRI